MKYFDSGYTGNVALLERQEPMATELEAERRQENYFRDRLRSSVVLLNPHECSSDILLFVSLFVVRIIRISDLQIGFFHIDDD